MGVLQVASMVLNAAIAVLSVVGWLQLTLGWKTEEGRLAVRGLASLKYFTVLSNLLSGAVSLACAVCLLTNGSLGGLMLVLRLMAATAVMVTFSTVMVLLGPYLGWDGMFAGGNLWLHLVLPLFAAFDCCLLSPVGSLPVLATAWAMLPSALYAVWYVWMVRTHAGDEESSLYDFYGFLRWGEDKIPLVAAAMLLFTWGIGWLLWMASRLICLV